MICTNFVFQLFADMSSINMKGFDFRNKNVYDLSYTKTEICCSNHLQGKTPCEIFPKTYNYRYLPLSFSGKKCISHLANLRQTY